jgi:hypothetical protein
LKISTTGRSPFITEQTELLAEPGDHAWELGETLLGAANWEGQRPEAALGAAENEGDVVSLRKLGGRYGENQSHQYLYFFS